VPFVYLLECSDGSLYVGSTWDLERRIGEHQEGLGAAYTATRRPVRLVYYEESARIDAAYAREKQIQGWSRVKRLALINGDLDALRRASRKPRRTQEEGPEDSG